MCETKHIFFYNVKGRLSHPHFLLTSLVCGLAEVVVDVVKVVVLVVVVVVASAAEVQPFTLFSLSLS
jgi:hypothetical protein